MLPKYAFYQILVSASSLVCFDKVIHILELNKQVFATTSISLKRFPTLFSENAQRKLQQMFMYSSI